MKNDLYEKEYGFHGNKGMFVEVVKTFLNEKCDIEWNGLYKNIHRGGIRGPEYEIETNFYMQSKDNDASLKVDMIGVSRNNLSLFQYRRDPYYCDDVPYIIEGFSDKWTDFLKENNNEYGDMLVASTRIQETAQEQQILII